MLVGRGLLGEAVLFVEPSTESLWHSCPLQDGGCGRTEVREEEVDSLL